MLFSLNHFNNQAKHRRLIAIFDEPSVTGLGFNGNGLIRRIAVFGPENPTYPGVPYIWLDADSGIGLHFTLQIAFGETEWGFTPPVIETLCEFSRIVRAIIDLF